MKIILKDFIDFESFFLREIFQYNNSAWQVLEDIQNLILDCMKDKDSFIAKHKLSSNDERSFEEIAEPGAYVNWSNVLIGKGSKIESGAYIKGPAIIGRNVTIRSGAYIRENVLIGDNCVIGHASEIKHSILLNNSKAPHFNYIGNSIIGNNVNLGAGAICSNLKHLPYGEDIHVKIGGKKVTTGSRYFGCVIGDNSKIGCNVVINPGTLIGRDVIVYPSISIRGSIEDSSKVKDMNNIEKLLKHN